MTVIAWAAETVLPSAFVIVARMVVVPAETPVTLPLLSTAAIEGSSEDQAISALDPAGESVAVNLIVLNSATVELPETEIPVAGVGAVTSTVKVSVRSTYL